MDIAPVHIRRFPSLRCHRFHRVRLLNPSLCARALCHSLLQESNDTYQTDPELNRTENPCMHDIHVVKTKENQSHLLRTTDVNISSLITFSNIYIVSKNTAYFEKKEDILFSNKSPRCGCQRSVAAAFRKVYIEKGA